MTVVWQDVKFDEEKAMWCSLERELQIPPKEEILAPKEDPQDVVEQPQVEEQRVETTTQGDVGNNTERGVNQYYQILFNIPSIFII